MLHGIDTDRFAFREQPDDYLLFLGRFTEGKGVLQAIEVAQARRHAADSRRRRRRLLPRDASRRTSTAATIVYFGEADFDAKVELYGGARALLYPIQAGEPFGLVLAEAMACGTPVAALDRGAVREVVDDGVTGMVFDDLDAMVDGLPRVFALDRRARPRARGRRASASPAWSTSTSPSTARIIDAHRRDARRDRRRRWPAGPCSPSSRTPTTSRSPAAARWPGSPTPARASSCCARRAAKRGRRDRRSCRDDELGRVRARELREAAAVLGIAEVDHRSIIRTAICAGRTSPSCTRRSSRCIRALPRRRRSSPSARTASTGTSITSASTSARRRRC